MTAHKRSLGKVILLAMLGLAGCKGEAGPSRPPAQAASVQAASVHAAPLAAADAPLALLNAPPPRTPSTSAAFSFSAAPGAQLECTLDSQPPVACQSPFAVHGLSEGAHRFSVRAQGAPGGTPASVEHRWEISAPPAANPANRHSPLGTNLNKLGYGEALWLIDQFPRAEGWLTQCDDCTPPPTAISARWNTGEQHLIERDAHGWPVRFAADPGRRFTHIAATLFAGSSEFAPAGDWIVLYEGKARLEYGFAPFAVPVDTTTAGRHVVRISPERGSMLRIRISHIDPQDPIRNIRVIPPGGLCNGDPFAYAATPAACPGRYESFERVYQRQRFHPVFLQELRPYRSLRFMQFQATLTQRFNAEKLDEPQQSQPYTARNRLDAALWAAGNEDGDPPHELMFELSNLVGADPWVHVPFWADDGWVREFALTALNQTAPGLNVYLEWGNEFWNDAYPYGIIARRVERWAAQRWPAARESNGAPASGFTRRINYVGMRSHQICAIWKEVWGSEAERVRCIMPGGPFDFVASEALACPLYAAEGKVRNCAGNMYALATAPYFGGLIDENRDFAVISRWTREADGGVTRLFDELESGRELGKGVSALASAREVMRQNKAVAERFGVAMLAYEGGQHLTPLSALGTSCNEWSPDQNACVPYRAIQKLYLDSNRDPRMGRLYADYLRQWREAGGQLFMHYHAIAKPNGQFGAWGAKEHAGQPSSHAPKHRALMDFIDANPCWWQGCARP